MRIPHIDHDFQDPALLEQALTHRSASSRNNERLEFLGDAVLGYLIADALFRRYPQADEGRMTRYRAALINRASLADVARELDLGARLNLGEGELKSGGFRRESINESALEAVIGAIALDGGIEAARRVVDALFRDRIEGIEEAASQKDPKTALQEFLQARRRPLPEYRLLDERDLGGEREFVVECSLADEDLARQARGPNKRHAEQDAARQVLEGLNEAGAGGAT